MKLTKALKLKNQLAGEVAQLKDLLAKQNVRSTKQKFDYDNREVLARLRAKLDELVLVKTGLALANAEAYEKIFRLPNSRAWPRRSWDWTRSRVSSMKVAASANRATKSNTPRSSARPTWTNSRMS